MTLAIIKTGGKQYLVKAGDKVKFDLEKIKGQFTVTKIEKAK